METLKMWLVEDYSTIILVILILLFVFAVALVIVKSFRIVGPNQTAVKLFLGKPVSILHPGFAFVFWPFYTIRLYTTEILIFSFTVKTAKTKQGKVTGYGGNKDLGPADVDIKCKLFTYFAKDAKLFDTIKYAHGNTAPSIGPAVVPYVIDMVRSSAGCLPWPIIDQERQNFVDHALTKIIPGRPYREIVVADGFYSFGQIIQPTEQAIEETRRDNPLIQLGLDVERLSLSVEDVNLSDPELAKKLDEQERARLDSEAKRINATAERFRLEEEGTGVANARKAMIEVIKENPDLELMLSLREMAKGTSNTILYQLPHGFEERLGNILGGKSPKDFLAKLSQDDWKIILDKVKNLTEAK